METHKFYCSGETLTRLIADAFADLNNIERGEGDALSYEVQIRRALDAGIEDGAIQKLCAPSFVPCDKNTLFENCVFKWDQILEWAKSHLDEEWPLIPPWASEVINQQIGNEMTKPQAYLISEQDSKPWLNHVPGDPEPTYLWYTPARYFAREFVKETPTLINKRNLLSEKVAEALPKKGVYGRSKKKALEPQTILKSFNNITF